MRPEGSRGEGLLGDGAWQTQDMREGSGRGRGTGGEGRGGEGRAPEKKGTMSHVSCCVAGPVDDDEEARGQHRREHVLAHRRPEGLGAVTAHCLHARAAMPRTAPPVARGAVHGIATFKLALFYTPSRMRHNNIRTCSLRDVRCNVTTCSRHKQHATCSITARTRHAPCTVTPCAQRGLDGAHGWRDLLLFISFHFILFDHSLARRYLDILIPARLIIIWFYLFYHYLFYFFCFVLFYSIIRGLAGTSTSSSRRCSRC